MGNDKWLCLVQWSPKICCVIKTFIFPESFSCQIQMMILAPIVLRKKQNFLFVFSVHACMILYTFMSITICEIFCKEKLECFQSRQRKIYLHMPKESPPSSSSSIMLYYCSISNNQTLPGIAGYSFTLYSKGHTNHFYTHLVFLNNVITYNEPNFMNKCIEYARHWYPIRINWDIHSPYLSFDVST